jgi:carbon monoxide dehydrogenase subunit G
VRAAAESSVEIEKTLDLNKPVEQTWAMLMDPQLVGACVPGVERVEVVDADHFRVTVAVKVSYIKARFTVNLAITERRAPHYLRSDGSGDEDSLTSNVRQTTQLELEPLGDDQTRLRMKASVDVFGRLGTFGYGIIRSKADQMWKEFADNLKARIE